VTVHFKVTSRTLIHSFELANLTEFNFWSYLMGCDPGRARGVTLESSGNTAGHSCDMVTFISVYNIWPHKIKSFLSCICITIQLYLTSGTLSGFIKCYGILINIDIVCYKSYWSLYYVIYWFYKKLLKFDFSWLYTYCTDTTQFKFYLINVIVDPPSTESGWNPFRLDLRTTVCIHFMHFIQRL
jgi:hypothetical protein